MFEGRLDEIIEGLLQPLHLSLQDLHRKVDLLMSNTDQVLTALTDLQADLTTLSTDIDAGTAAFKSLEDKLAGTPLASSVASEMTAIAALHQGFVDLHGRLSTAVAGASGPATPPGTGGTTGPLPPAGTTPPGGVTAPPVGATTGTTTTTDTGTTSPPTIVPPIPGSPAAGGA